MHCGDTQKSQRMLSIYFQTGLCSSETGPGISPPPEFAGHTVHPLSFDTSLLFCPPMGFLIVPFLWNTARPLSTAHTRDNRPLGTGATPASEPGRQAGSGRGLQLRLPELLDLKPPKPPHEKAGRASGSLPTTYDLSVIPKSPSQPPAWLKEALQNHLWLP